MGNRPRKPCAEEKMWRSVSASSPSMCRSPRAYCSSRVFPSNGRTRVARTVLCAPSALMSQGACACSSRLSAWRSTILTGFGSGESTSCASPTSSTPRSIRTPFFSTAVRRIRSVSACEMNEEVAIAAVDPREVEAKGALASAIEAGGKAGVAKPDHLVRQAAQLEQLKRARLYADGTGRRRGGGLLVDDADGDAQAGQF